MLSAPARIFTFASASSYTFPSRSSAGGSGSAPGVPARTSSVIFRWAADVSSRTTILSQRSLAADGW